MVTKFSCKNPMTFVERKLIKEGLHMNMSYREIAEYVGRSKSNIIRECKRLGGPEEYDPEKAQMQFEMIQRARRNPIKS